MGAYSLFRHGASFCGAEYGHRIDVQRTGRRRQAHYLLDITDSTSMDLKTPVESIPGIVQDKEIFRHPDSAGHRRYLWISRICAEPAPFLQYLHRPTGHIAFSGATHDIACDGVYMSELSTADQSKYIGWQGAFYNIAKIVATGGLVYLAGLLIEYFGETDGTDSLLANRHAWMTIMAILCGIMVLLGIYHIFCLPSTEKKKDGQNRNTRQVMHELIEVLADFFRKRHIVYYIFFIILYRFAEGFVMKIVPLFLKTARELGGLGLTEKEIGIYYGSYGAAAFVIGSLLAGYFIAARGLQKTLFILCCTFNLPFVVYTFFAIAQPTNPILICSGIVFEYFGYGFGFVGLTLFMMQQIAPGKHQMAHYAFASGIMNLGVMIPGMLSGWVCEVLGEWFNKPGGYEPFFIFVLIATIPAFLITYFVPFKYKADGTLIEGETD